MKIKEKQNNESAIFNKYLFGKYNNVKSAFLTRKENIIYSFLPIIKFNRIK